MPTAKNLNLLVDYSENKNIYLFIHIFYFFSTGKSKEIYTPFVVSFTTSMEIDSFFTETVLSHNCVLSVLVFQQSTSENRNSTEVKYIL